MKKLLIIGTGALAREVFENCKGSIGYNTDWIVKGFIGDSEYTLTENEKKKLPMPILGNVQDYVLQEDDVFICAIANINIRNKLLPFIFNKNGIFMTLIHKTSVIRSTAHLGKGVIVGVNALVGADAVIGDYCCILDHTIVAHDCRLEDNVCCMGNVNICGNVKIGRDTYLGGSSTIYPSISIGQKAFIGIGSVCINDIPNNIKVFGNPARKVGINE